MAVYFPKKHQLNKNSKSGTFLNAMFYFTNEIDFSTKQLRKIEKGKKNRHLKYKVCKAQDSTNAPKGHRESEELNLCHIAFQQLKRCF